MRLIDADELKEELRDWVDPSVLTFINNTQTVPLPDFKEGYRQAIIDGKTNFSRPKGEWIFDSAGNMQCTNCNFALGNKLVKQINTFVFSFCPDCGAEMKKGEKK